LILKDIKERTFNFAVRIIKLCDFLEDVNKKTAAIISKQLIRSGTSVGANVEEAQAGQSKADFISKMLIALKEARETTYWLKLLEASETLSANQVESIKTESEEIAKIIASIVIATKKNQVILQK
jgi:four helix bundle protein